MYYFSGVVLALLMLVVNVVWAVPNHFCTSDVLLQKARSGVDSFPVQSTGFSPQLHQPKQLASQGAKQDAY